jgi:hypothetical protein
MPRKPLKERNQKNPTDDKSNRVRSIIDNITGKENPDDIMLMLLEKITESGKIPSVGKYYVFVYSPKTPNIQYDQNPFVAVTDVFQWGFKGINFHWGEMRQYTWDEVAGSLYEIYSDEVSDVRELLFANIRLNS